MDPTTPQKDPMLQATLRQMADIALPPPVSMMPATWGWAVLAGLLVLVLFFALWLWLRRRAQNRYRREALVELAVLEATLSDEAQRRASLGHLAAVIKRTALAVWPREEIAALNGQAWLEFLKSHAGHTEIDTKDYALFTEAEYRLALATPNEAEARRSFAAARQWIEGHNVHP